MELCGIPHVVFRKSLLLSSVILMYSLLTSEPGKVIGQLPPR